MSRGQTVHVHKSSGGGGNREFSTRSKVEATNFVRTEMTKTIRRRMQIEIETHETTVIRSIGRHPTVLCETCGADVSRHVARDIATDGERKLDGEASLTVLIRGKAAKP